MQKKRWFMLAGVVAAVLSLSLLVAACGDDEDENGGGAATEPAVTELADQTPADGVTVDVSQTEWAVDLSEDTAAAGTLTFNLINDGTIVHNFRVAKTDLAPDDLPVVADEFIVDEDQLDILAVSSDLDIGESEEVTVDLEEGTYVLFCNIPSHYQAGVYAGFTVE